MATEKNSSGEIPTLMFKNAKEWSGWLNKNHAASAGVWMQLAKKDSGLTSVTYAEALDVALCYGWIDGQKNKFDDKTWLQKFTPRSPKSVWSKINRGKAEALIESGRMKPAGLRAIEGAKRDGRWESAYDGQSIAETPEDLQAELDKSPRAKAFFATLNRVNRYAILFRVQTAKKAETRAKRIRQFIEMLEEERMIHPKK